MLIKIYANDGKEFKGGNYNILVNQLNAYESDQKLKKEKEESERKTREEKQKKLEIYRSAKLKEINEDISNVIDKIRNYEEETGYKIIYGLDYSTSKAVVKDTIGSIDDAWDNILDDIFKAIRKK